MNLFDQIEEVRGLLKQQADLLVAVGTGQVSIRDGNADAEYQERDRLLVKLSKTLGLNQTLPWRTLWDWHAHYKDKLSDYQSRRQLIASLLRKSMDELDALIDSHPSISSTPLVTKNVVQEVLRDAEVLIREGRYSSVVDRLHTALHGHLLWICETTSIITNEKDPSITRLMRLVRENHPNFLATATLDEDMKRIFMSMGNILDALNTVRNKASPAHASDNLLAEPEARLAINAAQTILGYLDQKTQGSSPPENN